MDAEIITIILQPTVVMRTSSAHRTLRRPPCPVTLFFWIPLTMMLWRHLLPVSEASPLYKASRIPSLRLSERALRKNWSSIYACDTCNISCNKIFPAVRQLHSCENLSAGMKQPKRGACKTTLPSTWNRSGNRTWSTWWERSESCWKRTPPRTTCPGCRVWQMAPCPTRRFCSRRCSGQCMTGYSPRWAIDLPTWWRDWQLNNTLCLRSMRLLWPLVKEDKRLQIQQWIIAYRVSAVEADRVEQASSSTRRFRYHNRWKPPGRRTSHSRFVRLCKDSVNACTECT